MSDLFRMDVFLGHLDNHGQLSSAQNSPSYSCIFFWTIVNFAKMTIFYINSMRVKNQINLGTCKFC